jgi:hypothetical protein
MKKLLQTISFALLLFFGVAGLGANIARADVKIKTKTTSAGQTSEQVIYIKGKRQRSENNETSVMITQCDLRRSIQLAVPTKTYVVTPFDQKTDAATNGGASGRQQQSPAVNNSTEVRRGGIVTSTFTSTDTGERKKMFGYIARRIKTSMITESSPDACQVSRSRMETDGWYIDAQFALDCQYQMAAGYAQTARAGECRDEYRTKQLGVAKLGYPVSVTTTIFNDKGESSFTFSQEVVEIANAVLDSALFDAPADYRQVNDVRELYGAASMSGASGNSNDADDDEGTNGGATGAKNGSGPSRTNGVSAKREGVVRVGVAMTQTGLMGENVNASALAEAVRGALMSNLNNSTIEVVALAGGDPQDLESEAERKECDYVLYSTVAHKKGGGGGGFGGFLKKSAAIASGTIAPAGSGGAQGNAASSLKAKDELTLEYRLQRGAEGVVANTLKAKAKSDGEDLIAQLAGQAAASVRAAAVATKK